MNAYKRHDLVWISAAGKARIYAEARAEQTKQAEDLRLIFGALGSGRAIPGIVRREENRGILLPIGLVHPQLFQEQRLRVATFIKFEEVDQRLSPAQILQIDFAARNHCMQAAVEVSRLARTTELPIGILGSAGLEIATEFPYTNEESDLDLIIGCGAYDLVGETCRRIVAIGERHYLEIDLEVELPNGYGIKAKELFMQTQTILGKSVLDVKLLARNEILKLLK